MQHSRTTSMADQANTTPGAVSRRFLFSVAAALPVAAAAARSSAASAAPTGSTDPGPIASPDLTLADELATLLLRYRDVGFELRAVDAELTAGLAQIPAWARPVASSGAKP